MTNDDMTGRKWLALLAGVVLAGSVAACNGMDEDVDEMDEAPAEETAQPEDAAENGADDGEAD